MLPQKKGQITTEFVIFSGLALIASIIFIAAISDNKVLHQAKEFFLVKGVALKVKNEVSITSNIEDGYTRQFELPEKINNRAYNTSLVNNTLTIWTNSTNTTFTTRILNITGYLKKGSNNIKKTNGVTYLNT